MASNDALQAAGDPNAVDCSVLMERGGLVQQFGNFQVTTITNAAFCVTGVPLQTTH